MPRRDSSSTKCDLIFDSVKACFQSAATSDLSIGELTDKMRETSTVLGPGGTRLTIESVYRFFAHLPENFELNGDSSDLTNVIVRFRALQNSAACLKSKRACPPVLVARPNADGIVPARILVEEESTSSAARKLSAECCALIMNAFISLGNTNVALLQLREFLTSGELPYGVDSYFFHTESLDQFLSDRPYLFKKTGRSCYVMFDLKTASLIVRLNNAIWREGRSLPLTSLLEAAREVDPAMSNVAKLEPFLSQHRRLFKIQGSIVTVERQICGFELAVDYMERLG